MPNPTPKYKSVKKLSDAIEGYFQHCDDNDMPYTVTGLAIHVGLSREQLIQYQSKDKYYDTIKKAKDRCEEFAERQLFQGKNVAGVIFSLKNNWKWVDKQEHTHGGNGEPIKTENVIKLVRADGNTDTRAV